MGPWAGAVIAEFDRLARPAKIPCRASLQIRVETST
jgi:hypothetical protein